MSNEERRRRYLDAICEAFQEAPDDTEEAAAADKLLEAACRRLGLKSHAVFAEWSSRVFLTRAAKGDA